MVILIGLLIVGIGVGLAVGIYGGSRMLPARRLGSSAAENLRLSEEAKRGAEAIRREAQVVAREEALKLRADVERELQGKRGEIIKLEERVLGKEGAIDRKLTEFERREQGLADRETHLKSMQDEMKAATEQQLKELERISGLTVEEAKRHILERSEELVRHEMARVVRQTA